MIPLRKCSDPATLADSKAEHRRKRAPEAGALEAAIELTNPVAA